ncbi:hypothetical protein CaCOL14_012499 [Colletotrichum acutatum]
MAEPRDSTETSLPPYDAVSQPYQEVCPPTTLVIVGQSIHALTADSPPLYNLNLGISSLSDITTEVELSRVEPEQDGSGRRRHIYDLRYMRSGPGGYVKLPSDSPHYFIERASRRVPGIQDLGLKKSRLPGKECTTVLPVDIRGRTSRYSIPNFVQDSAPVFRINRNRWEDAEGAQIASIHDTTECSLVVTAALPRAQFDMLVALWCCKVWESGVANAENVHEGIDGGDEEKDAAGKGVWHEWLNNGTRRSVWGGLSWRVRSSGAERVRLVSCLPAATTDEGRTDPALQTNWMRRTGWPGTFEGACHDILATLTELPASTNSSAPLSTGLHLSLDGEDKQTCGNQSRLATQK